MQLMFLSFLSCLSCLSLQAQNPVPNPNFEIHSDCPISTSQINLAVPWYSPTDASPDYFHACGSATVGVPDNFFGFQPAFTGEAYAGMYVWVNASYREYIQVQLMTPLEENICYKVGFFVNRANNFCAVSRLGAYVSIEAPTANNNQPLPVDPQIEGDGGFYEDTVNWVEISGFFVAQGGEEYITIGNFYYNNESPNGPDCTGNSYYYIDSVYILWHSLPEPLPLELGPPIEACYEYEIDAESGDVMYHWEDGSNGPTLVVDESGTYSLTITQECALGIDSVAVTILGAPEVDLGPPIVNLCEGTSYSISLDPNAGDYTWQDGSNETENEFTVPGLYAVTLDDGCDITTDEILIEVTPLPEPFSLGNDTLLCEGETLTFSFDPLWGDFEWQDGAVSSSYTVSEPGVYSLTISNDCGSETAALNVSTMPPPAINLGADVIYWCENDEIEFEFDPDLGSFLWSDGTESSSFSIYQPGQYSVTLSNACGFATDEIEVVTTMEPVLFDDDTLHICQSSLPITLAPALSSPDDEFTWSTGETSPSIQVNTAGTFSLVVSNFCFEKLDEITLLTEDSPAPLTWPDSIFICNGDTVLLDATTPGAVYTWQDGTSLPGYTVTQSGLYAVSVTTACGSITDTVMVQHVPSVLSVDLGPDMDICPGSRVILIATTANATYTWNDLSTADTLLVTTAGMYSVTVQDVCNIISDTVSITFNGSPPDVSLPSTMTLCTGDSITVASNIAGVSYAWNNGSTGSSLEITSPGEYSLTVTNNCGTDADTISVLDGGPAPVVDLGNDIALCPGETVMLHPQHQNVENWLWQNGVTADSFSISGAGTVAVAVHNDCGTDYDTLEVMLLPDIPSLHLGNDTAICPGVIITLHITIPDVSISWPDGSQVSTFDINSAGQYVATIENACGISADTIVIAPLQFPQLELGPQQFLCPGELFIIDPGIDDVDFLWQDGSHDSIFITTSPGEYSLTITNSCGSVADSLLIIESTDGPQLDLGPDINGCVGEMEIIHAGISGVDYLWQDGSTGDAFTVTQSGLVILQVTNNCGTDIDTVSVDLSGISPATSLGTDTTICEGSILLLQSTATPGSIITWQDGSIGDSFLVHMAGTYFIHEANACGEHTDTIVVDMQSPPSPFSLGPDVILCPGETFTLAAPATTDEITWQDGSHMAAFDASLAQLYTLQIANACGTVIDSFVLAFDGNPPTIDTGSVLICPGDVIVLDVTQPGASYSWSTGSHASSITVQVPDQYAVTIITTCFEVSGVIPVIASDDCKPKTTYYIPNIFSPNGDQVNDEFGLYFNEDAVVIGIEGDIFDRWGNHVFASQAIPFRWDGAFNGKPMNPGVYVYRFTLTYSNGVNIVTEKLTGDVTLLR